MRPVRARFHEPDATESLAALVRPRLRPLYGWEDLDPLMDRIGDAHYVLLGEASHGTAEFYDWRRTISQRLIREKGFSFVAVEGDWPDSYRVNRYIKGYTNSGNSAREVLHAFERWPTWMWANEEVATLVEWLKNHNQVMADKQRVGFYGLDVYSLWDSMHAVLGYLGRIGGTGEQAARDAFECFEPFGYDVQEYAEATAWTPASCEESVVELLRTLRQQAPLYEQDGREAFFNAEQNALVVKNAEKYYRTMMRGDAQSWNVRDKHMAETLERLMTYHGPDAKAIVWEHNTHIGDARYTDMVAGGMINVGQLVRERHAEDVVLVGFSTYHGTVIAGDAWEAPMRTMTVPPARPGSWEDIVHQAGEGNILWIFDRSVDRNRGLLEPRGHRAIGVVYRPQHEAFGNYVPTVLPHRYDVLAVIDLSHALHPLSVSSSVEHEVPETFPTGL
jgi:erythromycin esterase